MAETARKSSRVLRVLKWIGIGLAALILLAIAVGAIWEQVARAKARSAYPPPGRLVDIGGRNMHLDCRGAGSPTIILEAGLDSNGSMAWHKVHDTLAEQTRTCAYDRAGVMWSDAKPGRQDAEAVADDLHALLAAARIDGPIVLVAHSLGGPYGMTYVRKYGAQVKGLVFVDASHPDQNVRNTPKMLEAAARAKDGLKMPRFLARIGWTGALRAISALSDPGPPPGVPPRIAAIGQAYMPSTLSGSLKEMESLDASLAQAGRLRDLGDRPLVVLSAQKPPVEDFASLGLSQQDAADFVKQWKLLQAEEAGWSKRSRHILVPDSGHYIQNERPDLVVGAVAQVVGLLEQGDRANAPAN